MNRTTIHGGNVRILGIVPKEDDICYLDWSASGVEFENNGTMVWAELEGCINPQGEAYHAYLGVFVQGNFYKKIRVERERKQYLLYESASTEMVKIRIIKLTEKQYDRIAFYSLFVNGSICPTEEPNHRILFIGDSITAGYGVLGENNISVFDTREEDVTATYAYQAAETLAADCSVIAWSGNGVISRWIPPEENEADRIKLMPDIFPYQQISQSDVIVSYLGTNDASYTRKNLAREKLFTKQYQTFLRRVHHVCPDAQVLLLCGLMESTLNESIEAVAKTEGYAYMQYTLQEEKDGLGTDGHPGPVIHQKAAMLLTKQLKKMMMW